MIELLMASIANGPPPYYGDIGVDNMLTVVGPTTDELYIVTGVTKDEVQGRGLFLWNARTDTFTNLGTIPSTVAINSSIGKVDNKIYITQGDSIDVYDTIGKSWSRRTGPIYGSIYHFGIQACVTYNGALYFFGSSTSTPGVYLKHYDHVNNTWSTEATYTSSTNNGGYGRGVVIGNSAYFFGGAGYGNLIIIYNFTTKTFTQVNLTGSLSPRTVLALYGGKIVFTPYGQSGVAVGKKIMLYDPATNGITEVGETNPVKRTAAGVVIGNIFKAYGGLNPVTNKPVDDIQSIVVGPPPDSNLPIPIISSVPITVNAQPVRNMVHTSDIATSKIWMARGVTSGNSTNTYVGYYDTLTNQWVGLYNWTASPPLGPTATNYKNKVYYFQDAVIWTYDTIANTMTRAPATTGYAFGPYIAPAFVYKDEIYQVGPTYSGGQFYEIVKWNPTTNVRTLIAKSGAITTNGDMSAIVVGDWICICGSSSDSVSSRVHCYNMVTKVWNSFNVRSNISVNPGLITDGKTFTVLGGNSGANGDVWTIDPNTGFNWKVGVIDPVKYQGAPIVLNTDEVVYYGGTAAAAATSSRTVIRFKYPGT